MLMSAVIERQSEGEQMRHGYSRQRQHRGTASLAETGAFSKRLLSFRQVTVL